MAATAGALNIPPRSHPHVFFFPSVIHKHIQYVIYFILTNICCPQALAKGALTVLI